MRGEGFYKKVYFLIALLPLCLLFTSCLSSSQEGGKAVQLEIGQFITNNDYDSAIGLAQEYISNHPNDISALSLLLQCYILDEQYERGAAIERRLISLDSPNRYEHSKRYAQLLVGAGQKSLALEIYHTLLAENPLDKESAFPLIMLYLEQEKYEKALEIALILYNSDVSDREVVEKIILIGEGGPYDWVDSYYSILGYLDQE
jgi:tetratricopeptide (TPR) repeat protein